MVTFQDALDFIYSTSWKGMRLDLSRITQMMQMLGEPQKSLKFVHIAGTNGKGSTAAMLASVLSEAGYRTGLYTSPYIHRFGERIQINGEEIPDVDLIRHTARVREIVGQMRETPTVFETITAIGLLYFHEQRCDIVVFEVGMGGRLDATNVIDTPEAAVITSIGLDHMAELGGTVEKIAGEKAGIIKLGPTGHGGVAVCHPQVESVERVISEKCREQQTECVFVDNNAIKPLNFGLDGQTFDYMGEYTIPLLGEHQLRNASVAIETVRELRKRGWNVSERALKAGLRKTSWPGRFEVLRRGPAFIVDGAHNPQGTQTAVYNLRKLFPGKTPLFIVGVMEDKPYREMMGILAGTDGSFLAVTPNNPRALPAGELALCLERLGAKVTACVSIKQAVGLALEQSGDDGVICALGSLYMIGEVRDLLNEKT